MISPCNSPLLIDQCRFVCARKKYILFLRIFTVDSFSGNVSKILILSLQQKNLLELGSKEGILENDDAWTSPFYSLVHVRLDRHSARIEQNKKMLHIFFKAIYIHIHNNTEEHEILISEYRFIFEKYRIYLDSLDYVQPTSMFTYVEYYCIRRLVD